MSSPSFVGVRLSSKRNTSEDHVVNRAILTAKKKVPYPDILLTKTISKINAVMK